MSPLTRSAKVSIVVASLGRPDEILDVVTALKAQTVAPHRVVLSLTSPDDRPDQLDESIEVLFGPTGSCVQRNAAIDACVVGTDIIVFMDDDYIPSKRFIERVISLFLDHPDIAGASGHLIADGIHSAGIGADEAFALVEEYDRLPARPTVIHESFWGLYGCNMAVRATSLEDCRFDERLPLYGWQEDLDFAARLTPGRIVLTNAFAGVHRGVKRGRTSGLRLGYSQVANPVYLWRKGTMGWKLAISMTTRNVLANHLKVFRPEPWVDRAGRLRGNWLAALDLIRGRIWPERITRMK